MDIRLRLVFNDTTAYDVLNALARHNALLYRAYPDLPGLYQSQTEYRREKSELWSDVVFMYRAGHEDCDALAAARAGELMARGWRALSPEDGGYQVAQYLQPHHIPAEVILRTKTDPNGIGPYHCIVRYQVGNHWYRDDPSARLGMYGPRRTDNPFGPHDENNLRRKGMVPEGNVTAHYEMEQMFEEARLAGRELFGAEYESEIGRRFLVVADADSDVDIEGEDVDIGWRTSDERKQDRYERRANRHQRRAKRKRGRAKNQMAKAKKWKAKAAEKAKATRPSPQELPEASVEEQEQQGESVYNWRTTPRRMAPQARRKYWQEYEGRGVTKWPALDTMQPPEADLDPRWTPGRRGDNALDDFMFNEPDIVWETVDEEILEGIINDGLLQGAWEASLERANTVGEAVLSGDLDEDVAQNEIGFIRTVVENIRARREATADQRKAEKENRKLRRKTRQLTRKNRRADRSAERANRLNSQATEMVTTSPGLATAAVPGMAPLPGAPGMASPTGQPLVPVGQGLMMSATQPGTSGAVINLGQGLFLVRLVPTGQVTPMNQNAVQVQTLQLGQQAIAQLSRAA